MLIILLAKGSDKPHKSHKSHKEKKHKEHKEHKHKKEKKVVLLRKAGVNSGIKA